MATVSHILQNLKTLCKVVIFCSSTCCGSNAEVDPTIGEEDVDTYEKEKEKEPLLKHVKSYASLPRLGSGEQTCSH